MLRVLALALAALLLACSNAPPVLSPLVDRPVFVDIELLLTLTAYDPNGDPLTFSFASDLPGIQERARVQPAGEERALFSWTPLASDVGQRPFEFRVSDGRLSASATVVFDVRLGGEGSRAPRFVQPLGTGTTLDLAKSQCMEVALVVEDDDSPMVTLSQAEPSLAGASVTQTNPLSGKWSFCPNEAQIKADDHHLATFAADDGASRVLKSYLIVLYNRPGTGKQCPGAAPMVSHEPKDVSSLVDVTVTANVSDDVGIKYPPLLYYSSSNPGDAPDLSKMTQLTMKLASGDMKSGSWSATIPNPVANKPAGSKAQLYYLVTAQDNDDTQGTCDHLAQAPAKGAYAMSVTNPGGSGGLAFCATCTADAQCGGAADNCVYLYDGYHCLLGCKTSSECPMGSYCSITEWTSIGNVKARQCLPNDYKCTAPMPSCKDDSYEENDSLDKAATITAGNLSGLKSCPAGAGNDDDWYKLVIAGDTKVDLALSSNGNSDLDLALVDKNGTVIKKSTSNGSNESLSACVTAGTYYVWVYAWSSVESTYSLNTSLASQKCAMTCQDDASENDDNAMSARTVDLNLGKYTSKGNAICAKDDDWFRVKMFQNETLYAKLSFTQSTDAEDLDIYIYDTDGKTNLTGCSETTPLKCDPSNGQGPNAPEVLKWPIKKTGDYYLVVHGWSGAQNHYDLCIGLKATDCP